jgi:protein arginine kinase
VTVDELLQQPCAWFSPDSSTDIIVSSRIRLARNLKESAFPGWAGDEERERIWKELHAVLRGIQPLSTGFAVSMAELDEIDKLVLFERHLISREHADKGRGSGLVASSDERIAIMVNEEDHLRLQALRPGFDMAGAWKLLDAMDTAIEKSALYAFSVRLGYLTACPTNVGTGMRASVMMHLPGLVLMNEINPVIKGISKIGLAVRGLWGEGTEAIGNMFQISNQTSLGEKEEAIIAGLEQIVLEIMDHEKNARARLLERKEIMLRDHVGRSYGILSNAHILSTKEALDLLSGLRLGIDLGILSALDRRVIEGLLLLVQPGHLQKAEGRKLKTKDRDHARAERVRAALAEAGKSRGSKARGHE